MSLNRDKGWRQKKAQQKEKNRSKKTYKYPEEKNWKMMYLRSEKLKRAKQLGFDYPIKTMREKLLEETGQGEIELTNLLFICSRNQWRSPTAENIWKNHPYINTKSAGTSPSAKKTVNTNDIRWADIIFVMEKKHKNRIQAKFPRLTEHKKIHILDIEDNYKYMDEELIEILKDSVGSYINLNETD
jgi:predicted protein tyrosine phosphatase